MKYPSYGGKGSDPRFFFSDQGRENFDDIFRKDKKQPDNDEVPTTAKTEQPLQESR